MWENVFENELNHCLAGCLDCSELRGRIMEGFLWSLGFSDLVDQAVVNVTCRILNLD